MNRRKTSPRNRSSQPVVSGVVPPPRLLRKQARQPGRHRSVRTKQCRCLNCGHEIDAAMPVHDGAKPSPGDVTICIECGHIMAFDHDLTMRALTDAEMVEVAGARDIVMAQRALAELRKKRR